MKRKAARKTNAPAPATSPAKIPLPFDEDIRAYYNANPAKRQEALLMQLVRNTAPAAAVAPPAATPPATTTQPTPVSEATH
jgi:hypothetical protein